MLIRVRFVDNQIGQVSSRELETLIRGGKIVAFERSSGWIEVSSAKLRKEVANADEALERRAAQAYRHLLRQVDGQDDV